MVEDVRGKTGFDVGHLNLVDGSLVDAVFEGDQFWHQFEYALREVIELGSGRVVGRLGFVEGHVVLEEVEGEDLDAFG